MLQRKSDRGRDVCGLGGAGEYLYEDSVKMAKVRVEGMLADWPWPALVLIWNSGWRVAWPRSQGGCVRSGYVALSARSGARIVLVGLLAGVLGACSTSKATHAPLEETFDSSATFSRGFDATPAQTCEAARRALLSQGYIATARTQELIEGRKNFQPTIETNFEINFRVVCVPQSSDGQVSLGFVTAQQDRYTIKKSASSASVGVSALGSLSLPFSSSSESLVKVGSETISKRSFYDSFFELLENYLKQDKEAP